MTHRRPAASALALAVGLALAGALAAPAGAQGATPGAPTSPEAACAALEGTAAYEQCLTATQQALDAAGAAPGAGPDRTVGATVDPRPTGRELSERNLADQARTRDLILVAVLAVCLPLIAWRWRVGARRVKHGLPEQVCAFMDGMVPPEVRAVRPDARAVRGMTTAERRLLREQLGITLVAGALPVAAAASLIVGGDDGIRWMGRLPIVFGVLAVPVVVWTFLRVKRAGRSGAERWAVLGLEVVQTPSAVMVPKGDGGVRVLPTGGLVLEGTRHGRRVRVEHLGGIGGMVQRTTVHGVPLPDGPVGLAPGGPGSVEARATGGTVVVDRTIDGRALFADASVPAAFVLDLAAVEAAAASLARA